MVCVKASSISTNKESDFVPESSIYFCLPNETKAANKVFYSYNLKHLNRKPLVIFGFSRET